ncbi:sulfite exporter TauE/SafE family protein [Pedobacter sp. MR2016-24]|uniref:sulfite exporter TauE/SafE family protein n=1 Tax=Pedobacter sp. MR2016-24 TaxID=2994466 RepID=UPI0022457F04|nr:sulfite exporter TauE/SafE family protein [Pedobacter sp. MR2016-24]MCX2482879.1 sulfite exporter TauE/SafE family protein [Pedobacter sp. MR2016-24]
MSYQHLAFMIGLLGSVHCVGMCGPLAFGVPSLRSGWFYLVLDKLLYQSGRIISYCILGVLIGLLGRQIWLAGLQQGVSILSGVLIILAALSRIFKFSLSNSSSLLLKPFNAMFSYALQHRANHLIIGLINGFLPCGFVYLAMAGALNTGAVPSAISYMFWFGLGTTPLMFIAAVSVGFTSALFRKRINQLIPFLMLFLGCWFMLRGLELNIPYLSPPKAATITECM